METLAQIEVLFGSMISLLLGVIAFFLKQLHSDFKSMEKDISEVKITTTLIKSEFKGSYKLLNQKVAFIEKRVELLETKILNHHE
jgi:hypothetical protein